MLTVAQTATASVLFSPNEGVPLCDLICEGKTLVTPRLAERILKEARFVGQDARLKQDEIIDHIKVLETMMRRGLFYPGGQISFVRHGSKLWLVNGYHRLQALVLYGKPIEFRVAVDEINSEEDVAKAFHRFDRIQRTRSDAQILSAVGAAEKHGLSKLTAAACWGAIAFLNNGMRSPAGRAVSAEVAAQNRIVDLRADAAEPWWPLP